MELVPKKEEVAFCSCIFEKSVKQNLDLAWNLPDYCADIQRILQCVVTPCISSVSAVGDRVTALGEVQVRLIYVNSNDEIDCFYETSELSVTCETKSLPEHSYVLAKAAVDYVNARAASTRRFTLNGAVSVLFRAFQRAKQPILAALDGCGSQTQGETVHCLHLISCTEKTFDLSETVELPSDEKTICKLLRADGCIRRDSVKAVNGKLLLKGELDVEMLYLADDDARSFVKFTHQMPISQIIDVPDMDENSFCDISLCLQCLQVQPRTDSTGSLRLFEITSKISAFVKAYAKRQQPVISDCYATAGDLQADRQTVHFCKDVRALAQTVHIAQEIELGEEEIAAVSDASLAALNVQTQCRGDELTFTCEALLRVLCKTEKGSFALYERTLEGSAAQSVGALSGEPSCTPSVLAEHLRVTRKDAHTLDVSFDCKLEGELYDCFSKEICVDAVLSQQEEPAQKASLTLYFSQQGERVWDIAKHYGATVAAIQEENDLTGDVISEERMLLVPSV